MRTRTLALTIGTTLVLTLGACTIPGPGSTGSPTPGTTAPVSSTTPTPAPATNTAPPPVVAATDAPAPGPAPTLPADFVDRIDGSTATIPLTTAALQLLRGTDAGLHHNTTDNAYMNLIKGTKDIIFVTAPSEGELGNAAHAGVQLEVIPVVKDALVFLANTANPVTGLTHQQVTDIYTGKLTNWSQVGGPDRPIIPYQRPVNSGSQTLFLQLAMGDTTPMTAPSEWRPAGMGDLVDAVSQYDNSDQALGYSVYYYTQDMYVKDNVKLVAIDGITPSTETISDGTYRYGTYYYAVLRHDAPAGSPARQFLAWCFSDQAQKLYASVGYVPLEPSNIVPATKGYGYYGSTADNTTQSTGTGGPVGTPAPTVRNPCPDAGCTTTNSTGKVTVTIPGYKPAQTAAQAWFDALPPAPTYSEPDPITGKAVPMETVIAGVSARVVRDLLVVERYAGIDVTLGIIPLSTDWAVFRLVDGTRLGLSDLFYNGVNYIEFINTTLLDEGTNQALSDCKPRGPWCTNDDPGRVGPFTGLPGDYPLFSVGPYTSPALEFRLPAGNPFFASGLTFISPPIDAFVPLNLPADLSPYGLYWRVDHIMVGNVPVDHLVRDYTAPNPIDQILNKNIDALVAEHPEAALPDNYTDPVAEQYGIFITSVTPTTVTVSVGGVLSATRVDFSYTTGERLS